MLPFVVLAVAVVLQIGVLARDQVLVTHAAREGARAAAVESDRGAIERAVREAGPLDPSRLTIAVSDRGEPGSRVTVTVRYAATIRVPLLHRVLGGRTLHGRATMRVER